MEHHPRGENLSRANSVWNPEDPELVEARRDSADVTTVGHRAVKKHLPSEYKLPTAIDTRPAKSPAPAGRFQTISKLSRRAGTGASSRAVSPQRHSRACRQSRQQLQLRFLHPASQ